MLNKIRILPQHLINQISAGEVVERPASILKELVENSIDANAKNIEISITNGGKTYLRVQDDGHGISKEELPLCIHPHATSKLQDDSLVHIHFLGFRGEALASIASVSNMSITSKFKDADEAYQLNISGNLKIDIIPNSLKKGTVITIYNLFYKTPPRLKFLRADSTESLSCYKVLKQVAIANPNVAFRLENGGKYIYNLSTDINADIKRQITHRAEQIIGKDFPKNAIFIEESSPLSNIYGLISIPTFHKSTAEHQYIIVNGRTLKDKFLSSIIKVAYAELLTYGKHPSYIIFIDINPEEIDVNVNPTKSEVRFKDPSLIKHLLFKKIRDTLKQPSLQSTNTNIGDSILRQKTYKNPTYKNPYIQTSLKLKETINHGMRETNTNFIGKDYQEETLKYVPDDIPSLQEIEDDYPLGYAKAQFHKNWIIAQNKEGLILVDQHAAHERITHERFKEQYRRGGIEKQLLLIPLIIEISSENFHVAEMYQERIMSLGLIFDVFGENILRITEYPSILGKDNVEILFKNLLIDLKNLGSTNTFDKKINDILGTMACHNSIRSGQNLTINEMNALLRKMEETQGYAQCSHGRPTYVQLSIKSIEKLFGRS